MIIKSYNVHAPRNIYISINKYALHCIENDRINDLYVYTIIVLTYIYILP